MKDDTKERMEGGEGGIAGWMDGGTVGVMVGSKRDKHTDGWVTSWMNKWRKIKSPAE